MHNGLPQRRTMEQGKISPSTILYVKKWSESTDSIDHPLPFMCSVAAVSVPYIHTYTYQYTCTVHVSHMYMLRVDPYWQIHKRTATQVLTVLSNWRTILTSRCSIGLSPGVFVSCSKKGDSYFHVNFIFVDKLGPSLMCNIFAHTYNESLRLHKKFNKNRK